MKIMKNFRKYIGTFTKNFNSFNNNNNNKNSIKKQQHDQQQQQH